MTDQMTDARADEIFELLCGRSTCGSSMRAMHENIAARLRTLREQQGAAVAWHITHADGLVVLRKSESVDSHMFEQGAADGLRFRPLVFGDRPQPTAGDVSPHMESIGKRKLAQLQGDGYVVNGVSIIHRETGQRGLVDSLGFVGWHRKQSAADDAVREQGWQHAANEWADVATNGPTVLRNIRDGLTTFDAAIEDMEREFAHCRAQQPALSAAPAVSNEIASFDQWYASVDARLWNNWDACNAAFHAGRKMALSAAPAPVVPETDFPLTLKGLIEYGRVAAMPWQGATPAHMCDLIGQMVPHLRKLDALLAAAPKAEGNGHE